MKSVDGEDEDESRDLVRLSENLVRYYIRGRPVVFRVPKGKLLCECSLTTRNIECHFSNQNRRAARKLGP